MPFSKEVNNLLQKYETTPFDAYQKGKELLFDACKPGGRFDPLADDDAWQEGRNGFHFAHNWFKEKGYYFASEKLLLEWWDQLGLLQVIHKKKIYRAEAAFLLSDLYINMADAGLALRWAMLMQADDILHGHPFGGGAGRQTLTIKLGMSIFAFDQLNNVARECLDEINKNGDWSQPAGFSEEVVCRFARGKAGFSLADANSQRGLPISLGYYQALYSRFELAQSANEKGEALEDIAFYLLFLLPGCVPHQNVLAEDQLFETDILVRNLSLTPSVTTDLLGRYFLIECKNRKEKIDVADIGYFIFRMQLTHSKFGIIFAKSGITGEGEEKAGKALIRAAFHENDCICIVITKDDLENIKTGHEQNFWWILLEKIEALRFGKPKKQT